MSQTCCQGRGTARTRIGERTMSMFVFAAVLLAFFVALGRSTTPRAARTPLRTAGVRGVAVDALRGVRALYELETRRTRHAVHRG